MARTPREQVEEFRVKAISSYLCAPQFIPIKIGGKERGNCIFGK
jgi:hypothetical protein